MLKVLARLFASFRFDDEVDCRLWMSTKPHDISEVVSKPVNTQRQHPQCYPPSRELLKPRDPDLDRLGWLSTDHRSLRKDQE